MVEGQGLGSALSCVPCRPRQAWQLQSAPCSTANGPPAPAATAAAPAGRRLHRSCCLPTLYNNTPLPLLAAMKPASLTPSVLLSLASRALLLCCAAWVAAVVLRALAGEAAAWGEHGIVKKLSLACVAPLSMVGLSSW